MNTYGKEAYLELMANGKCRAWTGGKAPSKTDWNKNRDLRIITRWFFRSQHAISGIPMDYWACAGTSCLERARILWNRAKLDAFATLNLN